MPEPWVTFLIAALGGICGGFTAAGLAIWFGAEMAETRARRPSKPGRWHAWDETEPR